MVTQTSSPRELATNGAASRERESIPALVRRLMDELATLFRQEIALATAEISGALTRLILGMSSLAGGLAVLYAGFLALVAAAILGLAQAMQPWLAALVVGLAGIIIGLVMVYVGKKALDLSQLKPQRSSESLRLDKDVLTRKQS